MQIRETGESERTAWNNFVAASPYGDLLQSYEWGDLKRVSGGWEPIRIAAFDGDRMVGAMSILKRGLPHLPKCIYYAPRGPVCDLDTPDVVKALTQAAQERGRRDGAILLKVDPPVHATDASASETLRGLGFIPSVDADGFGGTQPRCVMQLDLTPSLEQVLENCKPKWRYNIRLAERKGVIVRDDCTRDDLRTFYDILRETATRDEFLVRGFSYYEQMWDALVTPGYARLFLTEYEGEAVAGALSFIFGDKCWYTYGASSNRHRNVMPNHLMQWKMIEWAKNSGCTLYDFRGVSQKQSTEEGDHLSGLNRFKEGFGAQFVEYIGEFDLPFSGPWYWAWTKGKPKAISFLKSLRRRSAG